MYISPVRFGINKDMALAAKTAAAQKKEEEAAAKQETAANTDQFVKTEAEAEAGTTTQKD